MLEPSLLGHDHHRQPHRSLSHLHPRDHSQGHCVPAQNRAQVHNLVHNACILELEERLEQAPLAHARRRAGLVLGRRGGEEADEEESVWQRRLL